MFLTANFKDLAKILRETTKLTNPNAPRFYNKVVMIGPEAIVATDSFRIKWADIQTGLKEPVYLTTAQAKELAKMLPKADSVYVQNGYITVTMGGKETTGQVYKHYKGIYPDWRRVIPSFGIFREKVSKETMAGLIATAKTLKTPAPKQDSKMGIAEFCRSMKEVKDVPRIDVLSVTLNASWLAKEAPGETEVFDNGMVLIRGGLVNTILCGLRESQNQEAKHG